MSEKSEEATPKRLHKAREEGDSGASAFAGQAVAFLVALAVLPAAIRAVASWASEALREAIAHAADATVTAEVDPFVLAKAVVTLSVPALLAVAVTSGAVGLVQAGGFIATKKLAPDLKRLDVIQGFKGLVSGARLFAVARALVGASLVSWLAFRGLETHAADVARLSGRLAYVAPTVSIIALGIARDAALAGLALAVVDVIVVRRGWAKRLKMSKEEVKREHKESDGDPQMKAARERAHHEMLAAATVGNVKKATVVIVNPTHIACALRYDEEEGDAAPTIVAAGEGDLAQRILRAAQDFGVPVVRDVPLARALVELEVGEPIPEALYEAVAEILRTLWDEEEPADPAL